MSMQRMFICHICSDSFRPASIIVIIYNPRLQS